MRFIKFFVLSVMVCSGSGQAAVEEAITGLSSPVRLVAPEGDARLFVVQRNGLIRLYNQDGSSRGNFLDIRSQTTTGSERGLLGLAFPEDYDFSGRFYVSFTDLDGNSRIDRFRVDPDNPDLALPDSQENLLTIDQPFGNHNGGHIEFGPDGMLYIGMGDGGSGGDPGNRAQNDQTLLGKMLRIDVGGEMGYAIPGNNPFVGEAPLDEIWAKGLRNPWCFSFDGETGDLYIADVGQNVYEEIDVQPVSSSGGENYGWRLMEGPDCYNPAQDCNDGTLELPVYSYVHGGNPYRCSISGGYVYRGTNIPSLDGHYFFSDYCSNQIWTLTWNSAEGMTGFQDRTADMTPPGGFSSVASFGQDGFGELYVIDLGGKIYRIISAASPVPEAVRPPFLAQNAPNPFNPSTRIDFRLERDADQVVLEVVDVAGRLIRTLVQDPLRAGNHAVTWDGTDQQGRRQGSGLYLYRLNVDGWVQSRKMIMVE